MVRKLTQEEFKHRVYGQLGDRVDLSKFEYTGATGKSIAICPTHGEYLVSAASLSAGQACKQCYRDKQASGGMAQSVETVITRAQEVHGNKYEYDKGTYKNSKTTMKVVCPEHGEFWVTPEAHIKGQECPECSKAKVRKARVRGSDLLVPKMIEKWGDRFDFSHVSFERSRDKFTLTCKEHGEFQTMYRDLMKSPAGCPECGNIIAAENRRIPLETIHTKLYEKYPSGYTFGDLVRKIKNGREYRYITVTCEKHGANLQQLAAVERQYACKQCAIESRAESNIIPIEEFLRRAHKAHGDRYEYDHTSYSGTSNSIRITCKKHGEFEQIAVTHTNGHGCPKCADEELGLKNTLSQGEFIERVVAVHGKTYNLSKVKYKKMSNKVAAVCPDHGEFKITAGYFANGQGCSGCKADYTSLRLTFPDETWLRKFKEAHGDKYSYGEITRETGTPRVKILCDTHGWFEQSCRSHSIGQGCPRCARNGTTKPQIEIFEFISQHVKAEMEVLFKDNSRRKHDIFIPSLNLAIEYHGLIWHSTRFLKDPRNDYKRHLAAEAFGVRTIHIYQDEWRFQREVVKRTLLSAIGALPRVYARKTEVIEVAKNDAVEFFNSNHLQGAPSGGFHLGLVEDGELVACMSFSICRSVRGNKDDRFWELNRYAATKTVVGGAGKLLKAFLKLDLCNKLISYSDTRLFSGNMYGQLGFTFDGVVAPDYRYITGGDNTLRMHKSGFKRELLAKKFDNFDPNLSERDNCHNNGYYQVFDCGKKRWILNV